MILTAIIMVYLVDTAKANDFGDILSSTLGVAVYG